MKIMNSPFLRHKLQWFLLLVAMLTVSQGVWANFNAKRTWYFDNSKTNWSNVYIIIGRSDWTQAVKLTTTNEDGYYVHTETGWDNVYELFFADSACGYSTGSGSAKDVDNSRSGNYTANVRSLPSTSNMLCQPNSASGSSIAITWSSPYLVPVLKGTKIMFYIGEPTSWNQSTFYLLKNNAIVATTFSDNTVTYDSKKYGFVGAAATTGYSVTHDGSLSYKGHSISGTPVQGGAYWNSDNSTCTAAISTAKTATVTLGSSTISQGNNVSFSSTKSSGGLGLTSSIKFYATTDNTTFTELTVSGSNLVTSDLAAGSWTIWPVYYDTKIYCRGTSASLTIADCSAVALTSISGPSEMTKATASAGTYSTQSITGATYHWSSTITGLVLSTGDPLATATGNSITVTTGATVESSKKISVYATKDGCTSNTVEKTGISITAPCSAASVTAVTPNTAQTKSLPTSSATPSVAQAVTATYSGGNQIGWTVTPSTISGYTAATFDDASSSSTNLNMNYEGEYTATFGAGCGNTTDATLTTAKITVEPSEIYLAGPLFDGGSVWATNHKMTKGSTSFYYDWNAARTTGEFTLRTSNSASEPAYIIPNYAKNNYTGITAASSGNHNLSVSGVSFAVGDKVRVTAKYKGWNASEGKPEYDITFTKRCSYPTEGSLTAPSNVCSGENFTITLDDHTATNTTISWKKRVYDGSAYGSWAVIEGETGTSLTISQTAQTQYKARVTTTSGGCYKETTAVTVNMYANSSVSNVTLSSGSVCIGESGITASATKTLGKGEGAWSSSNTTVATVTSGGAITARAAGSANIIYTITGGCNGTVSNYAALTVNPNMSVAGVSVSLDNDDVCLGATPTASKSGSEVLGGGTAQFISSDPTVATVNATTGAISTLKAGTTNITYMVSGGCGSIVETDPVELTVKAKPTLTISPASRKPYTPITVTSDMNVKTSLDNKGWEISVTEDSNTYFVNKGVTTATIKRGIVNSFLVRCTGENGCQSSQTFVSMSADSETCE